MSHKKNFADKRKKEKIDNFLEGKDGLGKFALSLIIIKEMIKKYPYL